MKVRLFVFKCVSEANMANTTWMLCPLPQNCVVVGVQHVGKDGAPIQQLSLCSTSFAVLFWKWQISLWMSVITVEL